MRTLTLDEFLFSDLNISDISFKEFAVGGRGGTLYRFDGAGEHTLCYADFGDCELRNAGGAKSIFSFGSGTALYISEGAGYTLCSMGEARLILVKFKLLGENGEELSIKEKYKAWQDDSDLSLKSAFSRALECYMTAVGSKFVLKEAFYGILSLLSERAREHAEISPHFEQILPAIRHIERHFCENTSASELAAMCYISESYLRLKFKEFSGGISPIDYRLRLRVEKAKEMLHSSLWTADAVALALGFYDISHFYKIYKKVTGELPRKSK